MKTLLLVLGISICPLTAIAAPMYICTDSAGNKTYTQNPSSNRCQAINLGKPSLYSSAPPSPTTYATTHLSNSEPMPNSEIAHAPRPHAAETSADPNQIAALQNKLAAAQKALDEGKQVRYGNERNYAKYLERIANLEKAVKEATNELQKAQGTTNNF